MGKNKALLPFQGGILITRVVERLNVLTEEILVTTNNPEEFNFLNLPLFPDIYKERGALGGLFTALNAATSTLVAVVACDMAFVNPELLIAEAELCIKSRSDIVIPDTGEYLEPFHAIYRRQTCLPAVRDALDSGAWRVDSWFTNVKVMKFSIDEITRYDPMGISFFNINTPEDLKNAEEIAAQIN